MTSAETLTLAAYFFVLIILAIYGWHRYYLVYLYMSNRGRNPIAPVTLDPAPVVTIQLPLYNEMYVADRLIDAVCRMDYPRDRLEIQVLDDSARDQVLLELAVRRFAAQGIDIEAVHRADRGGYKAGHWWAETARGEFIAVFDADFIPTDFLRAPDAAFRRAKIGRSSTLGPHQPGLCCSRRFEAIRSAAAVPSTAAATGRAVLQFKQPACGAELPSTMGGWQRRADRGPRSQHAPLRGWRFVFLSDVIARKSVR
jgi:hypothetical protein